MKKKKGLYGALCLSAVMLSVNSVYAQGTVSVPVQCISKDENESLTYHIKAEAQSDGQIIKNRILQLKNNEKGVFNIEYLCPGTYKYEIMQFPGVYDNIDYDKRAFQATVFVSEDSNGRMNATLITNEKGSKEKSDGAVFVNKTKANWLDEIKKDAIESLEDIVTTVPDKNAGLAEDILQEYVDKIQNATSKEEVEDLFEEAKDKLEQLGGNPNGSKGELEEIKKDAIESLEDIVTTVPDKNAGLAEDILQEYVDKIQNATSKEEVKDLFEEAKDKLEQLGGNPNGSNEKLEEAKKDAIESLEDIAGTVPDKNSGLAEDILQEYIDKIQNATSKEEVKDLFEEAKDKLEQLGGNPNGSKGELEEIKKDVIESLEDIATTVPDKNAGLAEDVLQEYIDKIENATSKEEVEDLFEEAKDKLEQLGGNPNGSNEKLEEAKKDAIESLEDIAGTVPDKNAGLAEDVLQEYIDKIENATSKEEVKDLFEEAKDKLVQLGGNPNGSTEKLEEAKKDAIESLEDIAGTVPDKNAGLAEDILQEYIDKIQNATSKEEVKDLFEEAKDKLVQLGGNPNASKDKLDEIKKDLIEDLQNIAGTVPDKNAGLAEDILQEYIDKIQNATSKEEAKDLYEEAKDKLVQLGGNPNASKDKLDEIKKDLIEALQNIAATVPEHNSSMANGILQDYINKINQATSKEEAEQLFNEAKDKLVQLGANPNGAELAKAKNEAIASLNNMLNTVPGENFQKAKEALKEYINKIQNATSIEEVKRLFEEAKDMLAKYGGNPNAAVPYYDNSASSHMTDSTNANTSDASSILVTGLTFMSALSLAIGFVKKLSKRRSKK